MEGSELPLITSLPLLDTLKSNRLELLGELKKNYKYDYLQSQLYEIEKNINKFGIIRDLFLGNIGIEANKQLAFYELPTFELLAVIQFICQFTGINNIEELGCGIGLLCIIGFKFSHFFSASTTENPISI